jgi:2'-5' RNA ligase
MIRLFVALALPEGMKDRLAMLGGGVPGAKWVPRENLHLTLRFIGEVAEDRLADIHHGLSRVRQAPFDLALAGIGSFHHGRKASDLWVGADRNDALQQLHDKVGQALQREDIAVENRRFTPHVTLARVQKAPEARIAAFIAEHNLFRAPPFRVEQFTLFSSFLSSSNAIYTPEAEYPLVQ